MQPAPHWDSPNALSDAPSRQPHWSSSSQCANLPRSRPHPRHRIAGRKNRRLDQTLDTTNARRRSKQPNGLGQPVNIQRGIVTAGRPATAMSRRHITVRDLSTTAVTVSPRRTCRGAVLLHMDQLMSALSDLLVRLAYSAATHYAHRWAVDYGLHTPLLEFAL